ncbi:MAG: hypothetical protein R3D58_20060 [Saprospiraceae bacterium]|nr:hypothetical protein [Lewinellaceae bacterium]
MSRLSFFARQAGRFDEMNKMQNTRFGSCGAQIRFEQKNTLEKEKGPGNSEGTLSDKLVFPFHEKQEYRTTD